MILRRLYFWLVWAGDGKLGGVITYVDISACLSSCVVMIPYLG